MLKIELKQRRNRVFRGLIIPRAPVDECVPENVMKRRQWIPALMLAVLAGIATFFLIPKSLAEMSRQDLLAEAQAGKVRRVVIVDGDVVEGVSARLGPFRVMLKPDDRTLVDELKAMGVTVRFEKTPLGLI